MMRFQSLRGRKKWQEITTVLPSQMGLSILLATRPSVETLGYCQEKQRPDRFLKRSSIFPVTAVRRQKKSDALIPLIPRPCL